MRTDPWKSTRLRRTMQQSRQDPMLNKNLSVCCVMLLLVTTSLAATGPPSGRKLYKWVDQQGETHYGDHIPPEYANQEQHVFNSQGVETERIDALRSPEQTAADDQKKFDAAQRASRDKNLMNTYVTVAEIERLRDQRLALVADQIKVTSQFLEVLNGRMKKLKTTSLHFKPYSGDPKAPPMSDQIAEDLVRVGNDIHTQEENLREKRSEAVTMSKQFDGDIARFKELKGSH